jgi:hypothetical protein
MKKIIYFISKLIALSLVSTIIIFPLVNFYIQADYVDSRPNKPIPNEGKVFPRNIHGTIVYLTENEEYACTWLIPYGLLFGFIGSFIWEYIEFKENSKRRKNKSKKLGRLSFHLGNIKFINIIKTFILENPVKLKRIVIFLNWSMLILIFLSIFINNDYMQTRPKKQNPEEGRIFPLYHHEEIVYLNRFEDTVNNWLFPIGVTLGIIGGTLNIIIKKINN